jgi:hypothetical protein
MKHRMLCERAQDSSGKARTIAGVLIAIVRIIATASRGFQ